MIKTEQIISLIRSHFSHDDERFKNVALQISATEAKAGHAGAAAKIHEAINDSIVNESSFRIMPLKGDVADLLMIADKKFKIKDLVVSKNTRSKIERIIQEYVQQDKLHKFNLDNRRKILLYGPSGSGKTMTAELLASELNLPFIIVRTEKVVTKFMGETGLKLGRIFDTIAKLPAVYLFDEFDAIGSQRGLDNEVGEQRRILNTFLQLLERDHSHSIIVAATNNVEVLDKALFRRFDDAIEYHMPEIHEIQILLKEIFCNESEVDIYALSDDLIGKSPAEIKMICADSLKESIIYNKSVTTELVLATIREHSIVANIC